jgi:hypothetical protein
MKPQTILKATFVCAAFASFVASMYFYFAAGDGLTGRLNRIYVWVWILLILALGAFLLAGSDRNQGSRTT